MKLNVVAFTVCMISSVVVDGSDRDRKLSVELRRFSEFRAVVPAKFDEAELFGKELLDRYDDPQERGRIYYALADFFAQSGLVYPEKVVEYGQMAIRAPVKRDHKLRLCVYMGDASLVRANTNSFALQRAKAMSFYAVGINELSAENLPDDALPLPSVARFSGPDPDGSLHRRNVTEMAELNRVQNIGNLIMHRNVLTRQIVDAFSRPPFDLAAFNSDIAPMFTESNLSNKLREEVASAIKKGEAKAGQLASTQRIVSKPLEQAAPRMRILVLTNVVIAVTIVACVLFCRKLAQRTSSK